MALETANIIEERTYEEVVDELKSLQEYFYNKLEEEYGFERMLEIRVPGTCHGVTKDSVQITAHIFNDYLDVLIALPVDARADRNFYIQFLGDKAYLFNQRKFKIRTTEQVDQYLSNIASIAQDGSAIIHFNRAKVYYDSHPIKDEPIKGYNVTTYNHGVAAVFERISDALKQVFS